MIQVFRVAKKAGIVEQETPMIFLGFGTMNGKDGKPFKTREGGVMRLENLIADINEAVYAQDRGEPRASCRGGSQDDRQRSWAWPPSSTAICPTRRPRIMCFDIGPLYLL